MPKFCNLPDTSRIQRKGRPYTVKEHPTRRVVRQLTDLMVQPLLTTLRRQPDQLAATWAVSQDLNKQETWLRLMSEAATITPKALTNLESFMAAKLGQVFRNPNDMTEAGKLRTNMLNSVRTSQNLVKQVVRWEQANAMRTLKRRLGGLRRELGFSRAEGEELLRGAVEMGFIPRKNAVYGNTMTAAFNEQRYLAWKERLRGLGLEERHINELSDLAEQYASIETRIAQAARDLGVSVGDLPGMGHMARIYTADMQRYFQQHPELVANTSQDLVAALRSGDTLTAALFDKTRRFQWYIPEDGAQVQHKMMEYLSAKDPNFTLLSNNIDQVLSDMVDNPLEFTKWLHDTFEPAFIDDLVDSGLMGKLPMTSTEVLEYLTTQYKLPFEHLNDLIVSDPAKVIDEYTANLAKVSANSKLMDYVSTRGRREGWVLTDDDFRYMGDTINGVPRTEFVSVDVDALIANGVLPGSANKLRGLYLHRVASEQLSAVLQLTHSPAMLGNVANAWVRLNQMATSSVIGASNAAFLARVFHGTTIGVLTATKMNPLAVAHLPYAVYEIARTLREGGGWLDDTKPILRIGDKTYTQQQALKELLLRRQTEYVPMASGYELPDLPSSGGELLQNLVGALHPRNIANAAKFASAVTSPGSDAWKSFQANPVRWFKEFARAEGDNLKQSIDTWVAPWTHAANLIDLAGRWSIMRVMLDQNIGRQGFVNRPFTDLTDFFNYVDEYVHSPDNNGTFARWFSGFVAPFQGYMMWNTPATIRHMLRHPQQYIAYNRIYSVVDDINSDACRTSSVDYASYQLDGYPVTVGCVNGNPITLDPKNYDQHLDATVYLRETGEMLTRIQGGFSGSPGEQRDQLTSDYIRDWFETSLSSTYLNGVYEVFTGRDTFTGRDVVADYEGDNTSFLGISMSPRMRLFLEQIAPLNALNRANPFGWFGRAPERDSLGLPVPGTERLSFAGAQRDDRDNETRQRQQLGALAALRDIGINIRVTDRIANSQYNYRDLTQTTRALAARIKRANQYILDNPNAPDMQRRRELIRDMARQHALLTYEGARLRVYLKQRGIPDEELQRAATEVMRDVNQRRALEQTVVPPETEGISEALDLLMENQ